MTTLSTLPPVTATIPASPTSATVTPRPPLKVVALRTLAALMGLLLLAAVTRASGLWLFALPFAATAGIIAVAPSAPFSQPRSILLGQLSGALTGLAVTAVTGPSIWAAAVAAALSTAPMLLLRAPHPPAGATAAFVGLTAPGWLFLVNPVLVASVLLIAGGWAVGKLLPGHKYPVYWR
ncbi:hypothetical protein Afil01_33950 [Actinorhabdospora filicis]|uniref:HPP transmembrane region domain-containing protein n=1 Tax=Actinorhabdospora filicis TaxID=1785913 RepID=A0A9W6SLS5_9ACTN|nr:HPP family protein [Actinorhabdospora filicis]GLZ78588.1 hypothetical protein Afil01_33950 [Actinorhabdospora filicis]